jgi:hypothetical protein
MTFTIRGEIWYWRGPAPFYFVTVPAPESCEIKSVEKLVTYGWGMIPATIGIGDTTYKSALWAKDGAYIVPLRASVRKAESLEEGQMIEVRLDIG